ncbi:rab11 family-interacting protein 2-like isoform X2 [Monodelphis domestica]|uniref:rab11 family-interacting protein 2-like isoform X2 n=1 Tax=Monodelphis domestica TaxID=13616 RepID=UPI0004434A03|nr:rab11 family-interacting protein 2-like isoform X2 [Monodelphis domestica]
MEQDKGRAPHEGAVKEKEWYPTHMQLTILRAQNLQAKGRSGFSNAYVIMRLQKQKYMTSVVRHNLNPEWKEDCILQLPGKLDNWEDPNLVLTVKHHSQWFADQFLGQISISLKQIFQDKTKRNNEWFILQSKSRKTNKYLGRLQLTIQFMEISGQEREPIFPRDSGSWSSFGKLHSRLMSKRSKIYKATPFPMPNIGDYSHVTESEKTSVTAPSSSGYTFSARASPVMMAHETEVNTQDSTQGLGFRLHSCQEIFQDLNQSTEGISSIPKHSSSYPTMSPSLLRLPHQEPPELASKALTPFSKKKLSLPKERDCEDFWDIFSENADGTSQNSLHTSKTLCSSAPSSSPEQKVPVEPESKEQQNLAKGFHNCYGSCLSCLGLHHDA